MMVLGRVVPDGGQTVNFSEKRVSRRYGDVARMDAGEQRIERLDRAARAYVTATWAWSFRWRLLLFTLISILLASFEVSSNKETPPYWAAVFILAAMTVGTWIRARISIFVQAIGLLALGIGAFFLSIANQAEYGLRGFELAFFLVIYGTYSLPAALNYWTVMGPSFEHERDQVEMWAGIIAGPLRPDARNTSA